jgi:perosamine synthetase
MTKICEVADKYNLIVLEDSAEALGSEWEGKKCGSFGLASIFSLYANKVVTSGEGGIILTNSEVVAERARKLRNLAFPMVGERRYFHDEIGFNYRLSNLLAALGLNQMRKVNLLVEHRIQNLSRYRNQLGQIDSIHFQPEESHLKNSAWMVGIRVDRSKNEVLSIRKILDQNGIETRPFFEPMHSQPALSNFENLIQKFPVADQLASSGFYLPSSSHLSEEELTRVSSQLIQALSMNLSD